MADAIKEAVQDIKFYLDRIEELTSRNKELEAALREIVAMTPDPEFGTLPIGSAIKVARAALGDRHGPHE
jgi:hypothetical protein